jgi:hypothetical protein
MRLPLLAFCALLAACERAATAPIMEQWRTIEVTATPADLGAAQVGRLQFRGGLELGSPRYFGGLSGIELVDGDRLLILNDDAEWFDTRLVLDEAGDLIGLTPVRYTLMRDGRGEPFANQRTGDSEDLAQLADGRFAVSFEQTQTIRLFDFNRDGPFGASVAGPRLAGAQSLPANAGLEAVTTTADGRLLIGAEGGGGRTPLWRVSLDAAEPAAPFKYYPLADGYSLTALDRLPDGGFVAVERFYAPVIGARVRITRFSEEALDAPGAVLSGIEVLAEIAPPLLLDNFEAITATRGPNGATRLYVVSDNNYNRRQRTLLYVFDIVSDGPPR